MIVTPHATEIRELVTRTFQYFDVAVAELLDLQETLRLEGGKLLAPTARAGDFMAMWLLEVGLLQFYDAQGHMLFTIQPAPPNRGSEAGGRDQRSGREKFGRAMAPAAQRLSQCTWDRAELTASCGRSGR